MEANAIIEKIKQIEIKTKRYSKHLFSGEYQSAFKGRGMAFSEVREYQFGDEVRTIDWNVSARFKSPYVKVFEEERELSIVLIIDFSASILETTSVHSKREIATELAAIIAFSAAENKDKVGAIFISDRVEKFIPPAKGKKQALLILREMIAFKPENKGTNINEGLRFFRNSMKKRSTAIVLSDFIDEHKYSEGFKNTHKKHDLVALALTNPQDQQLPNMGIIKLFHPESNAHLWINTRSKTQREKVERMYLAALKSRKTTFNRLGIDFLDVNIQEDYYPKLIQLLKSRR